MSLCHNRVRWPLARLCLWLIGLAAILTVILSNKFTGV